MPYVVKVSYDNALHQTISGLGSLWRNRMDFTQYNFCGESDIPFSDVIDHTINVFGQSESV